MVAYEGAFSDEECQNWLNRMEARIANDGIAMYAVILKETGEFVGQCGLTMQELPQGRVPEIGYLFKRRHWHKGYCTEAAQGCKDYAFNALGYPKVYSIIRDNNFPSQAVALRNGMAIESSFVKHYRGVDMPHYVFSVEKP